MTAVLIVVVVVLATAVLVLAAPRLLHRTGSGAVSQPSSNRRILLPFVAEGLSERALDAALRLAAAEGATLVPVFLARVSLDLPLDTPLPRQCSVGLPLLETIEQHATEAGIPVDSRIERGRNRRHALRQAIADERFDRIVVAAASNGSPGFNADDIAWLLDHAQGEVLVLRPSEHDHLDPVVAAQKRPRLLINRRRGPGRRAPAVNHVDETAGSR